MRNSQTLVFVGMKSTVAACFFLAMTTTGFGLQSDEDAGPLFRVAPEECFLYSTWSNQANPDPNSKNHVDQLLAEPEVAAFMEDLGKRVEKFVMGAFTSADRDQRQRAATVAPAFAQAMFQKSGCLFVEKVTIRDMQTPPKIEGALLLEIGDEADKVAKSLSEMISRGERVPTTVQIDGQPFYSVTLDDQAEFSILLGGANGFLIVGIGEEVVGRALTRMAGKTIPAWLTDLNSRHALSRRSSLGFINIDAIRKELLPLGGPPAAEIVEALGLANVQSMETSAGYSETEMVNRFMLRLDGEPTGLLALNGEDGIQAGELLHIPADSLFAAAVSIDPSKALDFAEALMEQFSPREAEEMARFIDEFKIETGEDLREDILEKIGSTWCLYNGASDGWISGLALTVSVSDTDQLTGTMNRLIGTIKSKSEGSRNPPLFSRHMVGKTEVHTLQILGVPLPIEPSWCISENRLIVTLFPQTITPIVRPMEYPALVDAEVMRVLKGPSGNNSAESKLIGFGYQDSQRQFELFYPYVQMLVGMSRMLGTEMSEMPPEAAAMVESLFGGLQLPPARSIHKHLVPLVSVSRRTPNGFESETRQTIPMVDVTVAAPIAIGMLLPAVQQVRAAARRTQSVNNLRQLALASLNYESAHLKFPAGFAPENEGQPPVSWRVRILPYIEGGQLYEQYDFDEPWDSENNLRLLEMMPEYYRSPTSMAEPGMTVYRGIGGPGGMMGTDEDGVSRGRSLRNLTDGTSNTILFVETSDELAVPWTKPDEGIDPEQLDLDALFGMYPGGTNVVFCDGSVRFIPDTVPPETLRLLMLFDDGEMIPWEQLER